MDRSFLGSDHGGENWKKIGSIPGEMVMSSVPA